MNCPLQVGDQVEWIDGIRGHMLGLGVRYTVTKVGIKDPKFKTDGFLLDCSVPEHVWWWVPDQFKHYPASAKKIDYLAITQEIASNR